MWNGCSFSSNTRHSAPATISLTPTVMSDAQKKPPQQEPAKNPEEAVAAQGKATPDPSKEKISTSEGKPQSGDAPPKPPPDEQFTPKKHDSKKEWLLSQDGAEELDETPDSADVGPKKTLVVVLGEPGSNGERIVPIRFKGDLFNAQDIKDKHKTYVVVPQAFADKHFTAKRTRF